jgi:hypothetical protein
LSEPFVYNHFKQDVKKFFSKFFKNDKNAVVKEEKFSNEPLCAFANSAMNIEFVYLILLGINNFMDNQITMRDMEDYKETTPGLEKTPK